MNKKNLPRAIQPGAADSGGAGPAPGTIAPDTASPARPGSGNMVEETMEKETMASDATPEQRRAVAVKLVERFSLWSGVAGLIPVPLVDLAAVGGVQIQMVRRLSQIYDVPFSENLGKSLIASLAGTMIPATSGIGASSVLKGVPVFGMIISGFVMPALSAGATYAIGMAFIQHFASGGTLLDFKPTAYRDFIKSQKEMWSNRR
jgi:uncharacterized protein (DUF697 family)